MIWVSPLSKINHVLFHLPHNRTPSFSIQNYRSLFIIISQPSLLPWTIIYGRPNFSLLSEHMICYASLMSLELPHPNFSLLLYLTLRIKMSVPVIFASMDQSHFIKGSYPIYFGNLYGYSFIFFSATRYMRA